MKFGQRSVGYLDNITQTMMAQINDRLPHYPH